jgi:hypothetical protein
LFLLRSARFLPRGLVARYAHSMLDFVSILKTSIDKQGTSSPEVRATIYERARGALDRLAGTHSPLEVEDYKTALKKAIEEIERSYAGSSTTTPDTQSPSSSPGEDKFLFKPQIGPAGAVRSSAAATQEATPTVSPARSNGAERVESPPPAVDAKPEIERPDSEAHLPGVYMTSYRLEASASSNCSICHKWAICVDPTHCWNRQ